MIWLALKLTFYNKVRLAVTIFGVVFSTYLTLSELALYIGMMQNATSIIRNSDVDIWIASKGVQNFDFAKVFSDSKAREALRDPRVSGVAPLIINWGFLKLKSGAQELVEIIGYDTISSAGGPWLMEKGKPSDVENNGNVIFDQSSQQRLGKLVIGDEWELNDIKVKLIGLSQDAKTFTTAPIVFTSYDYVLKYLTQVSSINNVSYLLVKLKDKNALEEAKKHLAKKLPDNDVLTTADFVWRTVAYWTIQTGMGAAFCLTALLGLVVGAGIIGQTVFANTMENIGEFATLKAMGASARELNTIILSQAAIDVCLGFFITLPLAFWSKPLLEKAGVSLALDGRLISSLFVVILLIAMAAAYFSIRRVKNTDPATIFRS